MTTEGDRAVSSGDDATSADGVDEDADGSADRGADEPTPPGDAELIARVRGRPADPTSTEAFAVLYARHHGAARSLARQLARSPADVDDLVAGAFARLLEVMRAGHGPTEAFRAYLLTALRHSAYDRTRAERRLDLTDDLADLVGVDPERTVVPFDDPALAGLERSLAARAFATLPERWQAVLWHLEVEGDTPAEIAPLFGMTANAVSALGYRAREGLRQAYLQEHLASNSGLLDRRHRETSAKLGSYTRGGLSRRDARRVEAHLAECEECRSLAAELREVNSGLLRSVVGPLVLGGAIMGYLAARGGEHLVAASTGELTVAGGGALGVLGVIGGAVRPAMLVGALAALPAGAVVAAVGVVGTAGLVTGAAMLGGSDTTVADGAAAVPRAPAAVPGAPAGRPGAAAAPPVDPGHLDPGHLDPGHLDPGHLRPPTPPRGRPPRATPPRGTGRHHRPERNHSRHSRPGHHGHPDHHGHSRAQRHGSGRHRADDDRS